MRRGRQASTKRAKKKWEDRIQNTVISHYKIGDNLARPLQFRIFSPLEDLETQVILETFLWPGRSYTAARNHCTVHAGGLS